MKLKDILTKKELDKIKLYLKKEIDKDPTSWVHGIRIKTLKDYYKKIDKLEDSESLKNICAVVNDKRILIKIQKHIRS